MTSAEGISARLLGSQERLLHADLRLCLYAMSERVATGIAGLDRMLDGGFLPRSTNLVWGAPGAGKTTLGLEFVYRGALGGSKGLWVSFEEFPHVLYRDAISLGWDLQALEAEGKLQLVFTSPKVFLQSLLPDGGLLHRYQANRVVLDSVSHFRRITQDRHQLRRLYSQITNGLRKANVTSLLIGESNRADFGRLDRGQISFLADSIITLSYVEVESSVQRAMVVLKMRGSNHAKEIRRFEIRRGGIAVLDRFENREGILSGMSRWVG